MGDIVFLIRVRGGPMKISDLVRVINPKHKRFNQEGRVSRILPTSGYVNVRYFVDDKTYTIREGYLELLKEDF